LVTVLGRLQPLAQTPAKDVHYQIAVDGKPVYYVQDAPHLEYFSRAAVHIEGVAEPGNKSSYLVLHVKKIFLLL